MMLCRETWDRMRFGCASRMPKRRGRDLWRCAEDYNILHEARPFCLFRSCPMLKTNGMRSR